MKLSSFLYPVAEEVLFSDILRRDLKSFPRSLQIFHKLDIPKAFNKKKNLTLVWSNLSVKLQLRAD
jgi:hypothetical protein